MALLALRAGRSALDNVNSSRALQRVHTVEKQQFGQVIPRAACK